MKYILSLVGLGFIFLFFQPNLIHQKKQKKIQNAAVNYKNRKGIAGEYLSSNFYLKLDSGQVYHYLYQNQKTGKQIRGIWEYSISNATKYIILHIPNENQKGYTEKKLRLTYYGLEDLKNKDIYYQESHQEEKKMLVINDF